MAPQKVDRKLTTILFADVVGSSRLMGEDEAGTLAQFKTHRKELIEPKTTEYRGRIVKLIGDGTLMEFGSVVDAVHFAVDVQRAMVRRNATVPEDRRIVYRVAINIGDVVVEDDDIYGDGVNVAARLEGLAEQGGICVSLSVYNQVKNKVDLVFEDLGEQELKNIAEPVRAYRIVLRLGATPAGAARRSNTATRWRRRAMAGGVVLIVAAGAVALWQTYPRPPPPPPGPPLTPAEALPLPDKPSIAVLPFDNLSRDPDQDYFSDGLTETIITDLSKISSLFVIARNSTFIYKGKPVKVQQLVEELGVRYVLEGSVQIAGERLRVSAQLVDATTAHHLWAERYDHALKDIFAVQDEITQRVVTALEVTLSGEEAARLGRKLTSSAEAYQYLLRGQEHFHRMTKEKNALARQMFRKAVELDPQSWAAWTRLAWTHAQDARFGWSDDPRQSFTRAAELAPLATDGSRSEIYDLWGYLHLIKRKHEKAIALGSKAIALAPNDPNAAALLAMTFSYSGKHEEAIALTNRAMRLDPQFPAWYLSILGQSYYLMGWYDQAIHVYKEYLTREPSNYLPHLGLTISYSLAGQLEKARARAAEVLKIDPRYSLRRYTRVAFYKEPQDLERSLEALRKAGLPE